MLKEIITFKNYSSVYKQYWKRKKNFIRYLLLLLRQRNKNASSQLLLETSQGLNFRHDRWKKIRLDTRYTLILPFPLRICLLLYCSIQRNTEEYRCKLHINIIGRKFVVIIQNIYNLNKSNTNTQNISSDRLNHLIKGVTFILSVRKNI